MTIVFPRRYVVNDAVRKRFGDRVEWLGAHLSECDPLADRLIDCFSSLGEEKGWNLFEQALHGGIGKVTNPPKQMVDFFESVEEVPSWVDFGVVNRGGEPLLRATAFAALTLGLKCLVLGYCSPGGNKPLVFSGRLQQRAARRLNETAKYAYEVSQPDGMRQGAAGYGMTLRVRLVHAKVRSLIRRSGKWRPEIWGEPINQHDMVATLLLFSAALTEGLRQYGFHISSEEADHQVALWRYVGKLMGVAEALRPKTVAEAYEIGELILATQGPPDQDSRNLVHALVHAPVEVAKSEKEREMARRQLGVAYGMCRHLIGDDLADQLELPRTFGRHIIPVVRNVIRARETATERIPGLKRRSVQKGIRKWQAFLDSALDGQRVSFSLPSQLLPRR
jgi:hypothetical protein